MLEFNITAMTCGHCASVVTQTLQSLDPQAQVQIDLASHKLRVETSRDRAAVAAALADAGYAPDDFAARSR